jgi:hypothetical protein
LTLHYLLVIIPLRHGNFSFLLKIELPIQL